MMKKLLIFALVLGLASMASAVPVFRINPDQVQDHYQYSDVIEIQLYDDGEVDAVLIDAIGDGGAGGVAQEPQTMAPFGYQAFPALNYAGQLAVGLAGTITGTSEPPQTGVLYTFLYHVPDAPVSTIIEIGSVTDFDNGFYDPTVIYRDGGVFNEPILMGGPVIHVIPEPATIALLGLGGLLLRRKK